MNHFSQDMKDMMVFGVFINFVFFAGLIIVAVGSIWYFFGDHSQVNSCDYDPVENQSVPDPEDVEYHINDYADRERPAWSIDPNGHVFVPE